MFSNYDMKIIRRRFFNITICTDSMVELQSQNGDWWIILELIEALPKMELAQGKKQKKYYRLFHRHEDAESYHEQTLYLSVLDVVLEILDHDDFRLHNRGRTHFDELLDEVRASTPA